jgi:hypothetical protein
VLQCCLFDCALKLLNCHICDCSLNFQVIGRFHLEISVLISCNSASLIVLFVIVKKFFMRNRFSFCYPSVCLYIQFYFNSNSCQQHFVGIYLTTPH